MTEDDYRREVEIIAYERRRKALLYLYEERERERLVNERIIEVTKERVTEILSSPSSSLYPTIQEGEEKREKISFVFSSTVEMTGEELFFSFFPRDR